MEEFFYFINYSLSLFAYGLCLTIVDSFENPLLQSNKTQMRHSPVAEPHCVELEVTSSSPENVNLVYILNSFNF